MKQCPHTYLINRLVLFKLQIVELGAFFHLIKYRKKKQCIIGNSRNPHIVLDVVPRTLVPLKLFRVFVTNPCTGILRFCRWIESEGRSKCLGANLSDAYRCTSKKKSVVLTSSSHWKFFIFNIHWMARSRHILTTSINKCVYFIGFGMIVCPCACACRAVFRGGGTSAPRAHQKTCFSCRFGVKNSPKFVFYPRETSAPVPKC
jgi:hypothetical protein